MADSEALTLQRLGERETLARILPLLPGSARLTVGPGDDSAVLALETTELVTSCDMMIEGPDFRRDWSSPDQIGRKAMTSNLADIAAMGAVPVGVILAVAAPPETPVQDLVALARGVAQGLSEMAPAAGVLGGDLSTSSVLTLSVTVLGDMQGRAPVLRSGARAGDVVAVSGEPGRSQRGFVLLDIATADAGGTLPVEVRKELLQNPDVLHHLAPVGNIELGVAAADAGAHALMDISDGLVLDATRLADASGVQIDIDPDVVLDEAWLMGGEDHGFLATFGPDAVIPPGFQVIGAVAERGENPAVTVGGEAPDLERGGWDPYRDSR